ncbi:MAG: extensin family protein [Thalassovita sp.]
MTPRRALTCMALIWACLGSAVLANAPSVSLRPVARGEVDPTVILPISPAVVGVDETVKETRGLTRSLRPKGRPKGLARRAKKATKTAQKTSGKRSAICGSHDIIGERVGKVPGKISGCGIKNAVRVRSVSGVTLSQSALIDCVTAKALKSWIDRGLKPAVGRYGSGVSELKVFASYACRTRNSKKGAKISEHGKGHAIDIGVVELKDGSDISVLRDWKSGKKGRMLRKMHETACGPFGTVLGPESDRFHRDHFHFDTARYRNGNYCR